MFQTLFFYFFRTSEFFFILTHINLKNSPLRMVWLHQKKNSDVAQASIQRNLISYFLTLIEIFKRYFLTFF